MTTSACGGDANVELYFYGELPPGERAAVGAHIEQCEACRRSLDDLRAIDTALAARRVDTPDDWSSFMARLDARVDRAEAMGFGTRAFGGWMQLAAALALVAGGAAAGWTLSRATPVAPVSQVSAVDQALDSAGGSGLDRARVVLAGLAGKTEGDSWALERQMAARLLPEVALIRQAASLRGRDDLDDILRDVETLLLQASYAERDDAETLARLRRMIDRRDVLMRLSVAAAGAEAPYGTRPLPRPGA